MKNPEWHKIRDEAARRCDAREDGDCLSQLTQPGTKYGEHIHVFCECDVINGFQQGADFAKSHFEQKLEASEKRVAELEAKLSRFKVWGSDGCRGQNDTCTGRITMFVTDDKCMDCLALKPEEGRNE